MTATEDRELRRALHRTLGSVPPSPVPIEAIIRRGKGIRLRRAGAAVGALGLAGVIAVAALALHGSPRPAGRARRSVRRWHRGRARMAARRPGHR